MPTTVTLAPTGTAQVGTGTTIFGGSGSVHAALADSSDSTYIRVSGRRRLDTETARVTFTMPAFPTGAQIVSVALVRRVKSVVVGTPPPRAYHAFRCLGQQLDAIGGAIQTAVRPIHKDALTLLFQASTVATWVDEPVYSTPRGPDRNPWTTDAGGNLATLEVELGREDLDVSFMDVSKLSLVVTYQAQATVTVTAPTGTVTGTCRPTIVASYTAADSQPPVRRRFAIYSQAQKDAPGFAAFQTTPTVESGWMIGESMSWTPTVDLVNGVWWAYVQAESKFDGPTSFPTTVGSTSWTQAMTGGAPAALLVSAVHDTQANHIRLTAVPSGSSPVTHALAFQVSRDQGYTWGPVRGGLMKLADGMTPLVVDDHEFELNRPSRYRVLAYSNSGGTLVPAAAGYSAEIDVTARSRVWWLLDPLNPLDKIQFPVLDGSDTVSYESVMGIFKPATGSGVRHKYVVRGPSFTPDGEMTLMFSVENPDVEPDYAIYRRMVASGRTLLLQNPAAQDPDSQNLYVHVGPKAHEPEKVAYRAPGGRRVRYRSIPVGYVSTSPPPITA